ncbi:helix-turn-helix domain-containing protein [Dolichospermum planctonicum UHCC 0167]|nr:helix-turn-helix domain-containing protein [Dolichospermum planctonicum]MCW9683265.1 helix-turn-helix domain-containing protein [Dolichospermum planctonicum UHCC 0167]
MKARYQYRFYPTIQQQQSLAQLFGCVLLVDGKQQVKFALNVDTNGANLI